MPGETLGRAGPARFGRLEDDPIRIQIIGRDRRSPARELLGRIEVEAGAWRAFRRPRRRGVGHVGRHVTRGDLSVARHRRAVRRRPPGGPRRPAAGSRRREVIILVAIPIGILVGLLLRGSVGNLTGFRFRWAWVAVGGLLIQVALFTEAGEPAHRERRTRDLCRVDGGRLPRGAPQHPPPGAWWWSLSARSRTSPRSSRTGARCLPMRTP